MTDIKDIRNEIDAFDNELASIYSKRLVAVEKIAKFKEFDAVENWEREKEIIDRLTALELPHFTVDVIIDIWSEIFKKSKAIQKRY